jgi:phosphoglycerate dehydrogenase-like enzyme
VKAWIAHAEGLPWLGPLPDTVTVEVYPGGDATPSDPADVRFWTPPWADSSAVSPRMGRLEVVQLLSAGVDDWVARVPDGVLLCDASGVHTSSTSEWAAAAILAHLRRLLTFVRAQDQRRWAPEETDELAGKRVLVVGAGAIGEGLAARLAPFDVDLVRVARRPRPGVHPVEELPGLLPDADVVVVLVPLTASTRGLVDTAFLGRMRDGALLVNAGRGPVVDTAALLAELRTGRLAAALDVTDPEPLPADHPLWEAPNLLVTPHVAGAVPGVLRRAYTFVGEQLRRYAAGQPLANVVEDGY